MVFIGATHQIYWPVLYPNLSCRWLMLHWFLCNFPGTDTVSTGTSCSLYCINAHTHTTSPCWVRCRKENWGKSLIITSIIEFMAFLVLTKACGIQFHSRDRDRFIVYCWSIQKRRPPQHVVIPGRVLLDCAMDLFEFGGNTLGNNMSIRFR